MILPTDFEKQLQITNLVCTLLYPSWKRGFLAPNLLLIAKQKLEQRDIKNLCVCEEKYIICQEIFSSSVS